MEGFESNPLWAGIMGTHMVEASGKFLREAAKEQPFDEDREMIFSLVALYIAIAQAEVERQS